ncbi:S8 family peptidase [Burkholderia alba]|uniref:S8 family peptidase n=1 Tax=Burkholderia alba TaxID=2683677 RepID=UPI002B05AE8F|nr:S8 family peptidase [Burkholderia alba]
MLVLVPFALYGCGGGGDGDGASPATPPPGIEHGAEPPPTGTLPPSPPLVCDDRQADALAATFGVRAGQDAFVDQLIVGLHPRGDRRAVVPAVADSRVDGLVRRVAARWNAQGAATRGGAAREGQLAMRVGRTMSGGAVVVSLQQRMPIERAQALAAEFASELEVRHAEPDRRLSIHAAPGDPDYGRQWNFFEPDGGIGMPRAWSITTGSPDVVTAVLDTGSRPHADLAGNLLPGYSFVTSLATANNGHGRGPDASDPGDWVTQQELDDPGSPYYRCAATPIVSSWHGTRVAGLIGAVANNGIGIAGVSWQGRILPVRVLGKCGGATSDVADGIRWAAGLPVDGVPDNPHPAKVINLSLGGDGPCGSTFQDAIDDVIARGAVVVASTGNDGRPAAQSRPANCRGVVSVASSDRTGRRAWDSNHGGSITLSAPGADVWSTTDAGRTSPAGDTYASASGTSFAAPQVSGIVSLMLAVNPRLTPARVTQILKDTARPSPHASTATSCLALPPGAGIVDAGAAVSAARR